MCTITWLQLSDLHFGSASEDVREMYEKLALDVIEYAVEKRLRFDYLIIPGDIIDAKCEDTAAAYQKAYEFIHDIQKKLSIKSNNTFLVSGNHDVSLSDPDRRKAIEDIQSQYSTKNGSLPNSVNPASLHPTEEFQLFYKRVTGKAFRSGHILFQKNNIDVLCLDSSYTCTKSKADYTNLVLGIQSVTRAIRNRNKDKKMVVVAHHGLDWFRSEEKKSLIARLSSNNTSIYCCGHIHEAQGFTTDSYLMSGTSFLVSVSPSLTDSRPNSNVNMGYNIGQLNTDNNNSYIVSMAWNSDTHSFQQQWNYPYAGFFLQGIDSLKNRENLRVNSCELFLYRDERRLTQLSLASVTKIREDRIKSYEKLNAIYAIDAMAIYPKCYSPDDILKLSYALAISPEKLVANKRYVFEHRDRFEKYGKKKGLKLMPKGREKTQAVIFDFDGTLTRNAFQSSWEHLWLSCGFDVQDCRDLHERFFNGEFDHQTWCDITCDHFKSHGFNKTSLYEVAQKFQLIDDCYDVIKYLHEKNIELYIISGSVLELIKEVLGIDLFAMFRAVKANQMLFDDNDVLQSIVGTKYDFEGKGEYVSGILNRGHYAPNTVVYFGNSFNDHSVCKTGVKSICINPKQTQPYDPDFWTESKSGITTMKDFLEYIDL